jgi:hypothetical protein
MPSTFVTFSFDSGAQGFTPTGAATLAWDAGGHLDTRVAGKSLTIASYWELSTSFINLGVPAGTTIQQIIAASMQSRCYDYNVGAASTSGPVTLTPTGFSAVTLSASRGYSATDASFVTTNGTNATGLTIPAATNLLIRINNTVATGNSNAARNYLYQDNLTFEIVHTTPTSRVFLIT